MGCSQKAYHDDLDRGEEWWDRVKVRTGFKELVYTLNALEWHLENTPLTGAERTEIEASIRQLENVTGRPKSVPKSCLPDASLELKS